MVSYFIIFNINSSAGGYFFNAIAGTKSYNFPCQEIKAWGNFTAEVQHLLQFPHFFFLSCF